MTGLCPKTKPRQKGNFPLTGSEGCLWGRVSVEEHLNERSGFFRGDFSSQDVAKETNVLTRFCSGLRAPWVAASRAAFRAFLRV